MKKSERLLQILTYLRSKRTAVTARALAQRMNVSERTIYRDVQSLILSGVAIEGEPGMGYILRPGNDIPPLMFNLEEIESLMLGIRLVTSWTDDELSAAAISALTKIKAALPEPMLISLNQKSTKFLVPDYHRDERAKFSDKIRTAIQNKAVVQICYSDVNQMQTDRNVYPLGMIFWGAAWTLVSWCLLRNDYRLFRLDRLLKLSITEQTFTTSDTCSFQHYVQQYDESASTGFWE